MSALASPGRLHFSTVGGLRTHARVYGEHHARAVVILPGLGCASWMYHRLAQALSQHLRVYAYDPPGHGRSQGRLRFPATTTDLTDHLALWLQINGLIGTALLGHSLGGEVMLDLAARSPELVGPLIACSPTGIPANPPIRFQVVRLLRDAPRERRSFLLPATLAYVRAGPLRFYQLARDIKGRDSSPLAARLQVPLLLIAGSADPVVNPLPLTRLAATLPGVRSLTLPGAPHALTDAVPLEVARHTQIFLDDCRAQTASGTGD